VTARHFYSRECTLLRWKAHCACEMARRSSRGCVQHGSKSGQTLERHEQRSRGNAGPADQSMPLDACAWRIGRAHIGPGHIAPRTVSGGTRAAGTWSSDSPCDRVGRRGYGDPVVERCALRTLWRADMEKNPHEAGGSMRGEWQMDRTGGGRLSTSGASPATQCRCHDNRRGSRHFSARPDRCVGVANCRSGAGLVRFVGSS
jgi:hypothetical protein